MIIDASVASKWILKGEAYQDKARLLFKRHIIRKDIISVPDLFFYEIANTCATKTDLDNEKINKSLRILFKANLTIHHPNENDILQSARYAKKYKTSVYDMIYAVMAKKLKTILITADEKFIQKTNFSYVRLLSEYTAGTEI